MTINCIELIEQKFKSLDTQLSGHELTYEQALELKIAHLTTYGDENPGVIPFVEKVLQGISEGYLADEFEIDSALSMAQEAVSTLPSFVGDTDLAARGAAQTVINLTASFMDAAFQANGFNLAPEIGDYCQYNFVVMFARECADKFGLFKSQHVNAISIPFDLEENADTDADAVYRRCVVFNNMADPHQPCVVSDDHVAVPLADYVDALNRERSFLLSLAQP